MGENMNRAIVPGQLHPFVGRDLPWLLEARAATRADHPFLIFCPQEGPEQSWTYQAFLEAVVKFAGGLAQQGVTKHDFVVIHMDNCIEFLIAWHGCARLGAVAVTTNTKSSADELEYFIGHCGAKFAITEPGFEALVRTAAPHLSWVAVTDANAGEALKTASSSSAVLFSKLAEGDPSHAPLRPAEPLLFGSVQYTSGTTSRPKGVVWTHANALWGGRMGSSLCQITSDDIGHTCLPLYHTNALSYSHLSTLWAGSTLVFQTRFSASRYWSCVADHRCTWGVQIPFMLKALAGRDIPPHRLTRWGLGSINPVVAQKNFGIPCLGWFGMTETVSLPIVSTLSLPGRVGSMGTVSPGYEVQVRGELGEPVEFGQSGMMWLRGVRGISLFQEYLNNPEATETAFDEEGWFQTGDRVTPHADGHIVFDGRERDMLRVGAENVAESEIERVLLASGLVNEVAVVGKPHRMLDEVPIGFVTVIDLASDPTLALLDYCRSKLASFKVPAEIRIVTDFPRVTLGKIDKKTLRKSLAEEPPL